MNKLSIAGLLAIALATPALADEGESLEQATSRLRACAHSGSAGAPRDSLQVAVAAVRALCTPQLKRVRQISDQQINANHAGESEDKLAELRLRAWRKVDFDLALLVSRETGLQP